MFNSNINILIIDFSNVSLPYTLWLYNILDTKNSPVECTDVLKSDFYEVCLEANYMFIAPDERWSEKACI